MINFIIDNNASVLHVVRFIRTSKRLGQYHKAYLKHHEMPINSSATGAKEEWVKNKVTTRDAQQIIPDNRSVEQIQTRID